MCDTYLSSILNNKKIMFYGPGNTNDKDTIDIHYFDYIIITNNMIDIFFEKYGKHLPCKIIHITNNLYSMNHLDIIKKYIDNIEIMITVSSTAYNYLKENINKEHIYLCNRKSFVKRCPLGLSRILNLLEKITFKELYITGVTFYKEETKIEDCYENKKYIIKEGYKYNIFNSDKKKHNIPSNISYTKRICDNNKNITMCKQLHDILYK